MRSEGKHPTKEIYQQLRKLSCEQLWEKEVTAFDKATPRERMDRVALVRAVGVVFSESGTSEQKTEVRTWLRSLLKDPNEKIRRYAMGALPKIGAGTGEETELLSLLKTTTEERERKFLGKALDKIGGEATLEVMESEGGALPQQKVRASVARSQSPSEVRMDSVFSNTDGLRIHLRGRMGLEEIVRDEVEAAAKKHGKFKVTSFSAGLVELIPLAPFSLGDLYALRCFGTVGFVIGLIPTSDEAAFVEAIAGAIASPLSGSLMEIFTKGSIRYRLDFVARGHQRGAVRLVADRAYALEPAILNDAQNAPWAVDVHPKGRGTSVELRPRLSPDPRFAYRRADVPAASHPPLAACMANIAGKMEDEIVWDPFCGSGLELIERSLLGGVKKVFGTDRSAEAIAITQENFGAARVKSVETHFICSDFRDYATVKGLEPGSVSLIITNPPLGKRVPIRNLDRLFYDLFSIASKMLKPGGRFVFANPMPIKPQDATLKQEFRQVVDFGGFDCHLEMYRKSGRSG